MFLTRFAGRIAAGLLTAIGLLVSSGSARADMLIISGGGTATHPASFTGSIEVIPGSNTSATIRVTLTNTTVNSAAFPTAANGFLTGFGFNDPNTYSQGNINGVTSFSASYTPESGQSFQLISGSNANLGNIFGKFDYGASVGSTLHTSGIASNGLAAGETGIFTFVVSGTGLQNLTAQTLMNAYSTGGSQNNPFSVRFSGIDTTGLPHGGDGNKVPVTSITKPVPAPRRNLLWRVWRL